MLAAVALAIEGDGVKWNEDVIEDQDDVGPLMPEDKALAMIKFLGVFWCQTGAMLQGAID